MPFQLNNGALWRSSKTAWNSLISPAHWIPVVLFHSPALCQFCRGWKQRRWEKQLEKVWPFCYHQSGRLKASYAGLCRFFDLPSPSALDQMTTFSDSCPLNADLVSSTVLAQRAKPRKEFSDFCTYHKLDIWHLAFMNESQRKRLVFYWHLQSKPVFLWTCESKGRIVAHRNARFVLMSFKTSLLAPWVFKLGALR